MSTLDSLRTNQESIINRYEEKIKQKNIQIESYRSSRDEHTADQLLLQRIYGLLIKKSKPNSRIIIDQTITEEQNNLFGPDYQLRLGNILKSLGYRSLRPTGGSWALSENATTSEKTKYELCEKVIRYKRHKQLTTEKLAQKVQLSKAEMEDILYCRIDYLTLDRLLSYTDKLFAPAQLEITIKEPKLRKRIKITITDYYQTKPGRKMITHELIMKLVKTLDGREAEPEPKKKPSDREVFELSSPRLVGGRCEYGGAHNSREDCQTLAKFFEDISGLRNAQKDLINFNSREEFESNKQTLLNKTNQAISGLNMKTGDDFRKDVESLKRDIENSQYEEAQELALIEQKEGELKQEIEENERKAANEHINDFIQGIKDKLDGKGKPTRNPFSSPTTPNTNPNTKPKQPG
ncbi:825_t:CDS:2, partial [Diversispora eburnea]